MLTPDYLYNVSDRAIELYEQLNSFVIKDICRRLVNADYQFTGSIDWQLYKLQQSGMIMDDITREVAKITKKSEAEIIKIFEEATYKSQTYDNQVYRAAGLTPIDIRQSPQMLQILQATFAQTMGELKNFTKSTASVGQSLFLETMDSVYYQVMSGQQSYTAAVRQAINEVSAAGVIVYYPSGHKDTIETAVRRCVVTGIGQATARISVHNAEELDTDLVLVSAHLGARPEHAEWQGKVYSISGNSKDYRKLSEATGYGTVSGLCGANCRHHFMPYIEGVSHNPYENFESDDNHERYKNQQAQRKRERDIRTTKRELKALEESIKVTKDDSLRFALQQDYDRKAAVLKRQNASYKEFSTKKGLATQQERLKVSGWEQKNAAKARGAAKRYEDSLNSRMLDQVEYGINSCKDYRGLEKYIKAEYNVSVNNDVKALDFESVLGTFHEVDTVIKDIPYIKNSFGGLNTYSKGITSLSPAGELCFNPKYYKEGNKKQFGSGFHEAGHLIELAYAKRQYPDAGMNDIIEIYGKGEAAKSIVDRAFARISSNKSKKELIFEISPYAAKNVSELLAEAVRIYYQEGKSAPVLSRQIMMVIRRGFNDGI